MPPYNPLTGYNPNTAPYAKKKPKQPNYYTTANPNNFAGTGWGASEPWGAKTGYAGYTSPEGIWTNPELGIVDMNPEGQDNKYGIADDIYSPNPGGGGTTRRGSINVMGVPDYRGILDRYMGDMRARINTGLANMNANKLSNARALINRMGVRDPQAAFAKLGSKYGLTQADFDQAAANPWSELKAIGQAAERERGQGLATMAGRNTFRSGGSTFVTEEAENRRARNEALMEQETASQLAQGEQGVLDWQLQQEDALAQRAQDLEMELSNRYQPQVAEWDDNQGGYRWGNVVYDEQGNIIRRL